MHYNDQGTKTEDAIPVTPIDPTNSPTKDVPGNYPNDIVSDDTVNKSVAADDAKADSDDSDFKETSEETKKDDDSPEWFMKDKFKSIDEQAKSYKDLSTKMGKFWGSPGDAYKVDGLEGIESNDPLVAGLTPVLQEIGISQEGFNHLVTSYMQANVNMMKDMEANLKKTLTETDAHTYNSIAKWMDDSLTPEEAQHVKNNWLMSAEDFKLFNNFRLMMAPSTNVPSGTQNAVKYESSNEVTNEKIKYKTEVKKGLRVTDKNFENELASRFRDAAARELRNKAR